MATLKGIEDAVIAAGFRVTDDLLGKPTLWCKECDRDSGWHWDHCSKAVALGIPRVTFPVVQSDIKSMHERLASVLKVFQANASIIYELLRTLRTFCSHPRKTRFNCPDCGLQWSG